SQQPPTTELSALSLHDALPIFAGELLEVVSMFQQLLWTASRAHVVKRRLDDVRKSILPRADRPVGRKVACEARRRGGAAQALPGDRKSTRLNSSHVKNSYPVFC